MRRRRRGGGPPRFLAWLAFAALAVQFAAVAMIAPPAASAEVYTCGTPGNWVDGYVDQRTSDFYEGAYAYIKTEYGSVCDTDTSNSNYTSAAAMIAGSASGANGVGWAESGFVRWYGSNISFFAQQYDGASNLQTKFADQPSVGSVHGYYEKWQTDTGDVKSVVDATTFLTSTWNPFSKWNLPFEPEFVGAATYLESDIAGNASTPTAYTNLHGQDYVTNAWASYPCGVMTKVNYGSPTRSDGNAWYDRIQTCPGFDIYTDTAGS